MSRFIAALEKKFAFVFAASVPVAAGSRSASTRRRNLAGGLLALTLASSAPALAGLGASVTLQSGAPANILPGATTTLEITLSNNNPLAAITGVAFANSLPGTLPNALKVAGAPTYTCHDPSVPQTVAGSGTLTATTGGQAITLSGGVIPARHEATSTDGTCTILIPVTAGTSNGAATNYTYTILGGAVTGNDGSAVANVGDVSQSINVLALTQPTIGKSFSNSTAYLGGAARTLTITVTNTNTVPIADFSITDVFPSLGGDGAIIQVANPANANATCNHDGVAPSFSPAPNDTSVTASGGTVAARTGGINGSCTLTVDIVARHTNGAYSTGAQANTINAVSQFGNELGIRAQANASANITATSPLSVTKSFSPASLAHGQTGTMTITLSNAASSDLNVVQFDDSPIDGLGSPVAGRGLIVTSTGTTCAGGGTSILQEGGEDRGVRLTGGAIPAGGSCTVTAGFTATTQVDNTPITYTNSIPVGAVDVGDPAIVSQARTATILVADTLRVLKSRETSNPRPGNPVRYTVTVQNWSASDMNNVRVQDALENGMTFLTGVINGLDFNPTLTGTGCSGLTVNSATGAATADLVIGTVPQRSGDSIPGACVVDFYAMVSTAAANGASTVNTLPAGSVCTDNGAGFCNGGSASTTNSTVNTSVLTAAKSFSPAGPLQEGTTTRMTITLTNYSANPLTSVSISDTLPISGSVQMQVANPANAATTCGAGTITATPGGSSVALNNGTVPARANNGAGAAGTCVLQVDVVGAAGGYTNTATAAGTETYADGGTQLVGPVSANASITYNSVLSASKGFSPGTVASGGRSTVTVRLNNSGSMALTNVSVTDPLPTGMVLASPVNAYTTCAGATVISATPGASSITLTGASIAGGGNCDLLFDVIATGVGNWTNTIPAGGIVSADSGVTNQSAVSGTLLYNAGSALTVAKATNPSTLTFPGEVSRLTITLTNGSQAVTGLGLTDHFTTDGQSGSSANGMVITANPAASTTCPGGIVGALPGATSVSLSGATLAANASCTFAVNVTSTTVGGITNYIPVGAIVTHQGLTNAGQATTSLTTQTNIGVVKQFTPNYIQPGQRSRLRITFFNPSAQPATSLSVLDNLPAGVTVPAGPNPATTCAGATVSAPATNQVQVSGGTLAAAVGNVAASCHAEIDVTAASEGVYVNTIPAGTLSGTIGGVPATNSQPTSDTLLVKLPLVVHKAIGGYTLDVGNPGGFATGSASRAPGASVPLVVRLENPNTTDLTQAAFTDALPTGLVVATTPSASTTCAGGTVMAAASATSIALTGATIPASGHCTVTVNVLSNIPGAYTNTIPAGGVSTFEGIGNEEATRAEIVVSSPPTVAKQFSPPVIPPNGISTLTITIGNDNANAITLTSALTDSLPTLPGAMVVANPANVVKTCPGTVTATSGAGTVSYASGASVPAGGCAISVDVTAATPGTHNNSIAADALQTSVGNNQQPANAPLVVSTRGYVSGKVFRDNNVTPNGTFEAGTDSPIAGVALELRADNCAGALLDTTSTDAAGNYLFADLDGATYAVCQPGQPSATVNGITTAGTIVGVNGSTGTAGSASNPTSTSSQIVGIVLNADGAGGEISGSPNNNFAEVVLSSIAGKVFLDINNNGVINGADSGIAGETIELRAGADCTGSLVATTSTDAGGDYAFGNLEPGTYTVCQPGQPADTSNGITSAGVVGNGGTAGAASNPSTTSSRIAGIVLPPNTPSTGNDFAEIPNGRTISGRVFFDFDNNGVLDGADYGISGQTLNLTGTDINGNPVARVTVTAADGGYAFTGLPEGTYTVTQPNQPADTSNGQTLAGSTGGVATLVATTPSEIAGIDLTGGNLVSADNDFAEVPSGAPDLVVTKTHTPASFGTGSSTGYFTITPGNIGGTGATGTITVVDTLPAGMTVAAPATGTGWACSGAVGASVVSCTSTTVIPPGESGNPITLRVAVAAGLSGQLLTNTVTIAGGNEPPGFTGNNDDEDTVAIGDVAQVSGTVWLDANHDRVLDAGENRLAGWSVELLLNDVLVASAITDGNGAYAMTNLSPGPGYRIRFRHPQTGQIWGSAVANEQGIAPTPGVRDNPSDPVSTNAGNPAGAEVADGTLSGLTLFAGDNIIEQSLPVDPSGVVYDAITRQPVAGAVVTLSPQSCVTPFDPDQHLVGGAANLAQTTLADGYYAFMLTASAPQCDYLLVVTEPTGYRTPPSTLIPPSGTLTVANGPGTTAIQAQPTAPTGGESTTYHFGFNMSGGSQNVVNNHIPLEPNPVIPVPTLSEWALWLMSGLLALFGMAVARRRKPA